jgi:hypothetical protein
MRLIAIYKSTKARLLHFISPFWITSYLSYAPREETESGSPAGEENSELNKWIKK